MMKETEKSLLISALKQDVGSGDVTTSSLLKKKINIRAAVIIKDKRLDRQEGILAGLEEARFIANHSGIKMKKLKEDGGKIRNGDRVCILEGDAGKILGIERTMLNIICRMSGIASTVHWLRKAAGGGRKGRGGRGREIAATRKVPPNLLYFDKKAVRLGGGLEHRYGLCDRILIKGNHLDVLQKTGISREEAVKTALERSGHKKPVEIEVENIREAKIAAEKGADTVMLDNFTPAGARQAVRVLREIRKDIIIEISGGINPENIKEYAKAGGDYMSMGFITHSLKIVDMSLEIL